MKVFRVAATSLSIVCVQTIICGLALAPSAFIWRAIIDSMPPASWWRPAVTSALAVPLYVLFALCLMPVSALVTRLIGVRTPANAAMRIADLPWDLMRWAHYMTATHIVRLVSGTLFRGSPFWTAYVRMNGARVGRRVFINTLSLADHNLLDLGDDVVIGADVHMSGHTVENGVVKTAAVQLGSNVTVGLGSVIEIDVVIGSHSQIGALTFVPKHARLGSGGVYVGIPARLLDAPTV